MSEILMALLLTSIAGLSTGIGSLIAYFIKKPKLSYLSFALGLSAGVMIYVSFVELLPEGFESIGSELSVLIFFIGMGVVALIDALIPEIDNPHHLKYEDPSKAPAEQSKSIDKGKLQKVGVLTAVSIAIHNFPEGLVTFGTALGDFQLGLLIMVAIAVHNIPEGISVSLPIYYATGDKKKSFWWSFLSGVAEPIGAIFAALVLLPYITDALIGGMLAFISGIMVYVSLDEILPTAHKYGEGHHVIAGVVLGMIIMAISLLML